MSPIFFKISAHSIVPGDWGDYGDILQHGMGGYSHRVNENMQLERTGPFIPPVSFPSCGNFVVTTEARALLEESGLSGFRFQPVDKKLIVELNWQNWDLNAPEPAEYPEGGEPENYILGKEHSAEAAAALGDLWEIVVSKVAKVIKPNKPYTHNLYKEFLIDPATWDGSDIFGSEDVGWVLFTDRAQMWFFGNFGEYADFEVVKTLG